jgi:hypothetical protein
MGSGELTKDVLEGDFKSLHAVQERLYLGLELLDFRVSEVGIAGGR